MEIVEDDLTSESTRALLALHLAGMQATSPPEAVFALDLLGLQRDDVTVWSAREHAITIGVGALRVLADGNGEVKAMRTHPDHVRRGIGEVILRHIIAEARKCRMRRLSLETGSGAAFEPALRLYGRHGFRPGGRFGDYPDDPFLTFYHLDL